MSRQRIDTALKKAWTLIEANQVELALEQFRLAVSLEPADASLELERGVALFRLKRYPAAREAFEAAIGKGPKDPTGYVNAAKCLIEMGEMREALGRVMAGIATAGEQLSLVRTAGLCELALGNHADALLRFARACELKPQDGESWMRRAETLRLLGRLEDALKCAAEACAVRPGYPEGLQERARSLRAVGRNQDALTCLLEALKIRGKEAARDLLIETAEVALLVARPQDATAIAERLIERDKDDADAWLLKGKGKEATGDPAAGALAIGTGHMIARRYEEALVALERAISLRPRYLAALCNKAVVLERMGRPLDALACYDQALIQDPRAPVLWHNKANLLFGVLGRPDEALACYREEVKLDHRRWFEFSPDLRKMVGPP